MPVFNEEEFITEAIESILGQTYQKWELLIVDDHSKDNSMGVASSYAQRDSRILILQNTGKGKVAAFNTGFSRANGQYIHLFAGDDVLTPECLERCVSEITRTQCTAIYHDMLVVSEDLSPMTTLKFGNRFIEGTLDQIIGKEANIASGAWFFNKSASDLAWPLPNSLPYEDVWIAVCFKAQAQTGYLAEKLYKYRQHSNQTFGRLDDFSWPTFVYRLHRQVLVLEHLLDRPEILKYLSKDTFSALTDQSRFAHMLSQDKPDISQLAVSGLSIKRKIVVVLAWYMPTWFLSYLLRIKIKLNKWKDSCINNAATISYT